MNANDIRMTLQALAEPDYQAFNAKLLPGVENVLGVRAPKLRALAKQIAKEGWEAYLAAPSAAIYHEEILLRSYAFAYAKADFSALSPYITAHVETLSNWSHVDTFCGCLKVAKAEPEAAWAYILPYFERRETYPLRFAIVMALSYFLDDAHIHQVLSLLDAVRHEDYYVNMAVAWAVSMAYVAQPEATLAYLHTCTLDTWTYNKALQKIIESRQVNDEIRQAMRAMKRKG